MLKIMILIKARRSQGRMELATECEVSVRTIQRDINSLNYAGVPVIWSDNGYEIMPDFFLPPLNLCLEEAFYLAIAVKASCEGMEESHQRKIESALSKIVAGLPDETRELLEVAIDMATSSGKKYSQILCELDAYGPEFSEALC
jgi:predicted DNA-binding transcriptional regulator YafY